MRITFPWEGGLWAFGLQMFFIRPSKARLGIGGFADICGSRKFVFRALGHRTPRCSDPAHPHCRVSRRMPSPDIGVGTLLSVYVSGITATAQENPPSDDLPINKRLDCDSARRGFRRRAVRNDDG